MEHNTFAGLRMNVANPSCRALVDEMVAFRKQLTLKSEFNDPSGWDDPLNQWLANELGRIRVTVGLSSTQKATLNQEELNEQRKKEAADENQTLLSRFEQGNPITTDDVQMPASAPNGRALPFDFSGKDPNIPQTQNMKNVALVALCTQLDFTIKEVTRLSCQSSGQTIPLQQGAMIMAMLDTMFTILQTKGGQANRRGISDGTSVTEDSKPDVLSAEITDPSTTN